MSHLLAFSAPSRAALLDTARGCPAADLRARAAELAARPAGPHRLAIVASTPEEFARLRARAAETLAREDAGDRFAVANAAFYGVAGPNGPDGGTACLFPGFGPRDTTLLTDLLARFPFVEAWLDTLGSGMPETGGLARRIRRDDRTGALDTVLLADLAVWVLLRRLGLACDAVAGHSFGENAALVASGVVDDYPAIAALLGRVLGAADGSAGVDEPGQLGMIALSAASRPALDPLLASDPPRAFVSLDNCPQQVVVWGRTNDLAELERAVRARGEVVFHLPELQRPVHTPLFPVPLASLRAHYDAIDVRPGHVAAWSAASAGRFPAGPGEVRDLLARQWLMPVRFREMIERMHAEGIHTFVEVGPGDRLSGFVRDTLRGRAAAAVPTNAEGRSSLTQLLVAIARLFVRGHDLDLTLLAGASDDRPAYGASAASSPATETETAATATAPEAPGARGLAALVAREVAAILGASSADDLDLDRGLFDLGLGSIGCLELVERLGQALGTSVPQTLPFDHPTIRRLAASLGGRADPTGGVLTGPPSASHLPSDEIAVVGIGCRFPGGADSPDTFWRLLADGRDAVGPIPADRWAPAAFDPSDDPDARRRAGVGAFLDGIREFDAAFFGISPREAMTLDPQQRLLLEVSWEALEHAAIDPRSLAGSRAGVFVGISNTDYASRFTMRERLAIGGYLGTGNTASTAAGRISFVLGLHGPSVALDTACSSSLAAVHLACQSLRLGESDAALAGGVNLLINPETTIFLSHALALSPTGGCRTFDEAADGYVRGEGCGVVVLKRLADARAAGDRVLAVIRGGAMNHDGRTSGLTVPNGPAQEAVVRAALDAAGCAPGEVSYVEAHGTGTSLGDPIEVNALARVFGRRSAAGRPLHLGSAKTNIGHLEAASGIAGLIKTVLQIAHGHLAPSLHFETPNTRIDWQALGGKVVTRLEPWSGPAPRLAGVSSFGISGTNVHVIVGEPPAPAPATTLARGAEVIALSARSPEALRALAARLAAHLAANPPADPGAVARALTLGRAHFGCRRAFVIRDTESLLTRLAALAEGRERGVERRAASPPAVAFLFTGQGAQTPGMGRELYDREPVFRDALEWCDARLSPRLGGRVIDVMFGGDRARLDQTGWAQPALFAFEYALAQLWRHWGVEPAAAIGHSVGELVAACLAGVFGPDDALRLVAARATLMQMQPPGGAMLAVEASLAAIERAGDLPPTVAVAAVNGPEKIVLSGPEPDVGAVAARLAALGIDSTPLAVSHAFHSALMDPVVAPLREAAAALSWGTPRLPIISNLTGRRADEAIASADYWAAHVRETVRFGDGIGALLAEGCEIGLEIGPRPVLTSLAASAPGGDGMTWLASVHPPASEHACVLDTLAGLYEAGVDVDWKAFHGPDPGPRAALPTYPFERTTYWMDGAESDPARPIDSAPEHAPLLGARVAVPEDGDRVRFETVIAPTSLRVLAGTRLPGAPVLPVSAYLALAAAFARASGMTGTLAIGRLRLTAPLPLEPGGRVAQTVSSPAAGPRVALFSRDVEGGWTAHATWDQATAERIAPTPDAGAFAGDAIEIDGAGFYDRAREAGFEFGDALRVVDRVRIGQAAATAVLRASAERFTEDTSLVPLFDGAIQVLGAALAVTDRGVADITGIERMTWSGAVPARARVHVTWTRSDDGRARATIGIADAATGAGVADLTGIDLIDIPFPAAVPDSGSARETLGARLASLDEEQRAARVTAFLQQAVGAILHLPADRPIDACQPFSGAGLDSLMALQLSTVVQRELGVSIPPARIVENGSVEMLAHAVLCDRLAPTDAAAAEVPSLEAVESDYVDGEL